MNILYLGYWSVLDGLSESTIRPHLKVLDDIPEVNKIVYISIERTTKIVTCSWPITKMDFIPFYSPPKSFFRDKLFDFTQLPDLLVKLCEERAIDKIICRSSLAGAIGYLVWKRVKIPYYVESYEPHADYMLESGVWGKWDIRYRLQKYFEKKQKETARMIMPVSKNYKNHLIDESLINCPIKVIPCSVDIEKFRFDKHKRKEIRMQLGIDNDATIGIYVGKFGGIYYEEEAFVFINECHRKLDDFYMIILSAEPEAQIIKKMQSVGFPKENCLVAKVAHHEVATYLSASDISFNFHKKTKWSFALSPIKNGEYWANGLPIVIAEGIGDDSDIIKGSQQGGLVVDFENQDQWANSMREIELMVQKYAKNRADNECVQLAKSHRNPSIAHKIYKKIIEY